MTAITRRSLMVASLALVAGCRHELATDHPVPPPAARVRDLLLDPDDPAAGDGLVVLVGRADAARLQADITALVDEHGSLAPGPEVVIESAGVISANLNLSGPDRQPVGRVRVVVGPDGTIRQAHVLPAYTG